MFKSNPGVLSITKLRNCFASFAKNSYFINFMYLKINFGYHVYYVDTRGQHTKSTDNSIAEIFPKITK